LPPCLPPGAAFASARGTLPKRRPAYVTFQRFPKDAVEGRPLKEGYTDQTKAALTPAIELKREGRASLVRRDGMHSNELAQNSPDIVFVVRYLRICKGSG